MSKMSPMESADISFLRRRNSVPLSILMVVVIWLLCAVAASAQTIYCASDDGRRHTCSVDTRGGVRLVEQKGEACIQGRTWGYEANYIWVDHRCRANFEVGERGRDRDNNRDNNRDRDRDRGRESHGSVTWTGKVDHDVKLVIQGRELKMFTMSGKPYPAGRYYFSAPMPQDAVVTVQRIRGRNSVSVEDQPSRRNNYAAGIRITDGRGGSADCEIVISW